MAIEFIRMKLRRSDAAPVLLSGTAVLQPDGVVDLFGDAGDHAAAIATAIESYDAMAPLGELRLGELGDSCAGCPARRPAGACSCLVADRIRVGDSSTLTPLALRPGRPAAMVGDAGPATRAAVSRELTAFRAVRSAAGARAA